MKVIYFRKYLINLVIIALILNLLFILFYDTSTSAGGLTVDFVWNPDPAIANENVVFISSLYDHDPRVNVDEYIWDFGDDTLNQFGSSTTHIFASEGLFTVRLTISLEDGRYLSQEHDVQVNGLGDAEPTDSTPSNPEIISSSESFSVQAGDNAYVWAETNTVTIDTKLTYNINGVADSEATVNMNYIFISGSDYMLWGYNIQTPYNNDYEITYTITAYDEYDMTDEVGPFTITVIDDGPGLGDDDDDVITDTDGDGIGDACETATSLDDDDDGYVPLGDDEDSSNSGDTGDDNENTQDTQEDETDNIIIHTNIGTKVNAGEKVEFQLQKQRETGFRKVSFTPKEDLENVEFELEKLEEKPSEILQDPTILYDGTGKIYSYLDIKLTANGNYISDELESMIFEFEVEKAWLFENEYDIKDIKFVRYHNGWVNLEINPIEEDTYYYYFSAETPGLSTFAVVGSKVISPGQTPDKEENELPWIFIVVFIILAFIVLTVVLIKGKYIYTDKS